ncbi:MAG: hypothetical protein Ct9H90mP6_10350 [Gammaproteobacteria bacterium]|nr:MAG: hypothetical protein Ct9H90mP6_10350 [Gammaproteobacteria bacterium]
MVWCVTIGSIEKYITDKAFEMGWNQIIKRSWSGKKVAIVGAGLPDCHVLMF